MCVCAFTLSRSLSRSARTEHVATTELNGHNVVCSVVAEDGVAPLARFILPAVVSATQAASALQQKTALEALHSILEGSRRR
eukprot:7227535-Prymnesium_polylepis.2